MSDVLDAIERVELAMLPTPIDRLERASMALGVEIYVKRDDLTGATLSGNKVRKLEYSLAEARRCGATRVITCGGVQSNHCRATALAAASLGMQTTLFLRGAPERVAGGNLLLDWLAGADLRFISGEAYQRRSALMQQCAAESAHRGRQAFIIPEGASDALGSLGYVQAMLETVAQSRALGVRFDAIVCAVGSGGTYAGLRVGQELYAYDGVIWGIDVCNDAAYFGTEAERIFAEMRARFFPGVTLTAKDCRFVDGYKGRGYGLAESADWRLIRGLAATEGIVLDPVYTAKAWNGLLGLIGDGIIPRGASVLFLHTGGVFGLLPRGEEMGAVFQPE